MTGNPGYGAILSQARGEKVEVTLQQGNAAQPGNVTGTIIGVEKKKESVKDGAVALDGLVETDWLPFPFTMNWKFTRPGVIRFEAGEPFCFVTLAPHGLIDAVQPKLATLDDDPKLKAAYDEWSASRTDFGKRLAEREQSAVAEKWQRTYVQGRGGVEDGAPAYHLSKRRLKAPR